MAVSPVAALRATGYAGAVEPQAPAVSCLDLRRSFPRADAVAGVGIEVARGEIVALLGPSGCGKTTFLRLIAGLERPDGGTIGLGGRIVASEDVFVPPERRHVALVFQDYALFPHMTVERNVAYGLERALPRRARDERVREALALVGLADHASRYPHQLSGGEQQRVALARALAPEPTVILLDEPFSNLDADLRARVRAEVCEILRTAGATAIFVTHDQEEAFAIADRMAVMREGRLEQLGRPEEIYHTPATRFVADFVGSALFVPARVEQGCVISHLGSFRVPRDDVASGPVDLMVRPEDIVFTSDPAGEAEVLTHEFRGPVSLSTARVAGERVVSAHTSQILFHPGERVRVGFHPDHLVLFRGEERVAWVPVADRTGTDTEAP